VYALLWLCKMLVKSKRRDDDYQRQLYKRESHITLKPLRYVSATDLFLLKIKNKNFHVS
jgi:hypothetical protein